MKKNLSVFLTATSLFLIVVNADAQKLDKDLVRYCQNLTAAMDEISKERKETLREIGDYLAGELTNDSKANLIIVCTHNSRRSHIAQLWLQTSATYYGISGINAFSGGLEVTAFNSNAIDALKRAGFAISNVQVSDNPVYTVSDGVNKTISYSKKYNDRQNPSEDFGAVMVCSDADQSCPLVAGASDRFSLPYDDPRYYDGTASQDVKYDETVREIALEMLFLVDYAKKKQIAQIEAARQ
jgi:arsenate reductase (thioredoxin)